MRQNRLLLTTLTLLLLVSCTLERRSELDRGFTYAEQIEMRHTDNGIEITLLNPWRENGVLHRHIIGESIKTNFDFKRAENTIHTPLKRVIVMSNSHCRLLSEMGLSECVVGVCEMEYITDSIICQRFNNGYIVDCGSSLYPNIEKIMNLEPDAILLSPFDGAGYGMLEKLGIPIIECADYMEVSPLGRAEWCRFYGRLFGKDSIADSLFLSIETKYNLLKEEISTIEERPTVMLDTKGGSAWYVAGGKSTIGRIISDAGGEYIFNDKQVSGSIPLSFETVFEKAHNADFWFLKNSTTHNLTYKLLADDFTSYREFRPFQTKNIWVCDVYSVPYFEVTPFHPELLLQEFASILHPTLFSNYSRQWYHPMAE